MRHEQLRCFYCHKFAGRDGMCTPCRNKFPNDAEYEKAFKTVRFAHILPGIVIMILFVGFMIAIALSDK